MAEAQFTIPEEWRGQVQGVRVSTPLADELARRLAPLVAHLEATSPDGRHAQARLLAVAVANIRAAEVDLSGVKTAVSDERYARAKETVAFARQQLWRADLDAVLADVTRRTGGT